MASEKQTPDRIHIRDLQARCIIGINPDERVNRQDVVVNITMETDLRAASQSDDIQDTVDYATMKRQVLAMIEQSNFLLIERLAGRIAEICLSQPKIQAVRVSVEKPGALRFARTVGVEIERRQAEQS